jgi:hypothetical protein
VTIYLGVDAVTGLYLGADPVDALNVGATETWTAEPVVLDYATEIAADNPVIYASLNEPPGAPLSTSGTITYIADGPNGGGAAHFDGTPFLYTANPYPANLRPTNVTAEIWVRSTSGGNHMYLACPSLGTGPYGYDFGMFPGSPRWANHLDTTGWVISPTPVNDGEWHHIVGTFTSGEQNLYVDGVEVATSARAGTITYRTNGEWCIGARTEEGFNYRMVGDLASVAIYDHVLTPERVTAHFNASRAT